MSRHRHNHHSRIVRLGAGLIAASLLLPACTPAPGGKNSDNADPAALVSLEKPAGNDAPERKFQSETAGYAAQADPALDRRAPGVALATAAANTSTRCATRRPPSPTQSTRTKSHCCACATSSLVRPAAI